MSGGNRGGYFAAIAGIVCLIGALVAIPAAWFIGYLQGGDSVGRHQTPAAYRQGAQTDAERACVGMQGRALFECVYEKVEAGREQAHDNQDLSAQQRAANANLASALLALATVIVSAIGIYFIRRTIEQGQEALNHAKRVSDAQLRPYVFLADIRLKNLKKIEGLVLKATIRNNGMSPASDVDVRSVHSFYSLPMPAEKAAFPDNTPVFPTIRPGGRCNAYRSVTLSDSQMKAIRDFEAVVWCAVSITYRPYPDSEPETICTERVFYGPDLDRGKPRLIPAWIYEDPDADEDGQENLDLPPPEGKDAT